MVRWDEDRSIATVGMEVNLALSKLRNGICYQTDSRKCPMYSFLIPGILDVTVWYSRTWEVLGLDCDMDALISMSASDYTAQKCQALQNVRGCLYKVFSQ